MQEFASVSKGPFTWRDGAPVNRVTQLEGLTHSPPVHATQLTGTVSGLRELSFERPLSTTNKMADQRNFFHHISASSTGPIHLFRLTAIVFGR